MGFQSAEHGSDGYPDEFHGLSSSGSQGRNSSLVSEDLEYGNSDTSSGSTENKEMSELEVSTA